MSEAMMTDSNETYDLPRWQTHIDPLSSSTHTAQPAYYPNPLPPPPTSATTATGPSIPPTSPHRINTTTSRQPRISQMLEEQSPYLSRSQSLSTRTRRHHQPEDLEQPNYQQQQQPFYAGYQSNVNTPASATTESYSDMYYNHTKQGQPPPSVRGNRSPMRAPNTPTSVLLDPYSQQAQYSPTTTTYSSYAPPNEQQRSQQAPPFPAHNRTQSSQVKTEAMTPPIASPYTPSNYGMDTSPHPQPQGQNHLTAAQAPIRKNSASNPPTPMSFLHPAVQATSSYYPQDQPMVLDLPQKRRASGFRRIRSSHDLQPRVDAQVTGRRMAADGVYLSPLRQLTTNIIDTYRICNPQFRYESTHNPRRVLTKPSKPAHNEGYDNDDYDYILYVNDWLGTEDGHKYLILDILGQGTFGQVVKCQNMKTHEIVAVKVVKNKPAYFNQSMMEVTILEMLNKTCDPADEHHILRLRDSFIHRNHLCLVFELLSSNLYELIKQNQFQGLSTQLVKVFMAQLLDAMTVLKDARLIHCDLKPENILLKSLQSPQIKVIDFGSACHERQTVYTYIQSRFYRSPEVLLGMSYTASIDMWSLGCIAVELFLGLPLFPGTSEYNQLTRIVEMLGMPPLSMLNTGKQSSQFFDSYEVWNPQLNQNDKKYRLKSLEQYSREHNTNEQPGKQYFKATSLPEIIKTAPMPSSKSSRQGHELEKELNNRASFIDFCQGLLDLNPVTRWTPQQARMHPFITGEKFTKPFVPDGIHTQHPPAVGTTDPKRPYGGLVPSQPKGTRAYQDAASYNHHLTQHQMYTAQAQSQAANTFRNPYINQQQQQQQQQPQQPQQSAGPYTTQSEPQAPPYPQPQTYSGSNTAGPHRLAHQNSAGQLNASNSMPQYAGQNAGATMTSAHLTPNVPANAYYSNSRGRANTINQMDAVPPALARLQNMNQDIIAGRNALTPVLNRDDAMREWERRQSGKPAAAQPYPQLEFLQQQAELAATTGVANWTAGNVNRYVPPTSKLAHSYHPQAIVVDDDNNRHDAVMSHVRSAASRPDANSSNNPMYGATAQALVYPTTAAASSGPRYAPPPFPQAQQAPPSAFDSLDRRTDIGNMYVPMQPEQFSSYSNSPASTTRLVGQQSQQQQQSAPPSFYGSAVVATGQQPNRQGFDQSQQGAKERRGSGMDAWPR